MNPTDLTTERIAENQCSFREANEKIEAAADNMELLDRIPFICECADANCMEIVRLSQDEYEVVRQHPTRSLPHPDMRRCRSRPMPPSSPRNSRTTRSSTRSDSQARSPSNATTSHSDPGIHADPDGK